MNQERVNELICLHGRSMQQFPDGSEGSLAFADTVVVLGAFRRLVDALKALGTMPVGYCFCRFDRDPQKTTHTGECEDARAALRMAGEL